MPHPRKEIAKNSNFTTITRGPRWTYCRRTCFYGRFPHQKGFGRLTAEDKKKLIGHCQLQVQVNFVIVL